jgi:hypothetical protein
MRSFEECRVSRIARAASGYVVAAICAFSALGFTARDALADGATGSGDSKGTGAAAAPSSEPAAPEPPPPPPPAVPSTSVPLVGPIERLTVDAFPGQAPGGSPERHALAGLYKGSLWLNHDLHGLQWPYYPKTGIPISGSAWVDNSFAEFTPGEAANGSVGVPGQVKSTLYLQQSRFTVRVTPTWSNGKYFVQGQAELVAAKLAAPSSGILWTADDVWVKLGKWDLFDVVVGRFEAWEVYHFGMGLDLFTFERDGAQGGPLPVAAIYSLSSMLYRQDSVGQGAIHFYPLDVLRFEIGFHYGPETNGTNTLGVRPVAVFDLGWLKLKGGAEYRDQTGQGEGSKNETRLQGFGGGAILILDPHVELGVNGAWQQTDARKSDGTIDAGGSLHSYSLGGFANARVLPGVLVGGGFDYTFKEDTNFDTNLHRDNTFDHWQGFGAVQWTLWDQIMMKFVIAYAQANQNPTPLIAPAVFRNEMASGRLRLMYLF